MIDPMPDPPELEAASLAANEFTRVRRGLEPTEVRALLGRTADALRTWEQRDQALRSRIDRLEQELEQSRQLDETRIATVLGEETARIVTAARDAAADIRAKAENDAAELLSTTEQQAAAAAEALRAEAAALRDEAARRRDDAAAEATRRVEEAEAAATAQLDDARVRSDELLARASTVLEERTAEAEAAAAVLTDAAAARVDEAEQQAAAIRATAEAEAHTVVERARDEGREMLDEVRAVRERMLRDLADRRRAARRQLEAALAGRDRIVEVLGRAGAEVAATIEGLDRVDAEAEAAAEAAVDALRDDVDDLADLLDEVGAEPRGDTEVSPQVVAVVDSVEEGSAVALAEETVEETVEEATEETVEQAGEEPETATHGDAETDPEDAEADPGAEAASAAVVDGEPEESGGATVHDLFERLRTEVPDEPAEDDGATAGTDTDSADGSDTDGSDSDGSDSDGSDTDRAGEVVGIDLTDDEPAAALGEQTLLDRRDALLAPVEKQLARVLKRLASDEQNEILDRLRRVKRGRPAAEELLPGEDADREWAEALRAEFDEAVEVGVGFWVELAGPGPTAVPDAEAGGELLESRVGAFLSLHRAHLDRVVVEADEADLDTAELADRVRASYRDWRTTSLAEFAGDLAISGFAHGERCAAGPGTPWRWVVDNGGLPCADGEDNALAGAVGCEEPFPTGDVTPPAHPGCRCILAPVAH